MRKLLMIHLKCNQSTASVWIGLRNLAETFTILLNMLAASKLRKQRVDCRPLVNLSIVVYFIVGVIPMCSARTVGCAGFGLLEGVEEEMDEESCKEFVRRMGLPFLPRNGHFRDPRSVSSRPCHQFVQPILRIPDSDNGRKHLLLYLGFHNMINMAFN